MARTIPQIRGWAELLELCEDECEIIKTSRAMRDAVVEVERELRRLHEVENIAVQMAQVLTRLEVANDDAFDTACAQLWEGVEPTFRQKMRVLVPEAFDGPP